MFLPVPVEPDRSPSPRAQFERATMVAVASCTLCLDDGVPESAMLHITPCAHSFCKGCMSLYCLSKINEAVVPIVCPASHDCGGVLTDDDVKALVSDAQFKRYLRFTNAHMCECPRCGLLQVGRMLCAP
jgi:hypothetical protein